MRIVKSIEVSTITYSEELSASAEIYFSQNERILYVLKDNLLYGIITYADFNKNRNNGQLVNVNYKYITDNGEKSEEELRREAGRIFEEYRNVTGIPVVDTEKKLLYEFLREGSGLNVMPNRFQALYGNNKKLAEYISGLTLKPIRIATEYPEILNAYLARYHCGSNIEVRQKFSNEEYYESEKVFTEFEEMVFKEKLAKTQKRFFFELPIGVKISSLTEEEKQRVLQEKQKTTSYYLQNYGFDAEVSELAKKILGEDYCNQEFIDSLKMESRCVLKDGLCYNIEHNSKYVNVVNGRRNTTDCPEEANKALYIFGPCTIFGMLVDDEHTIPSYLQRLLGKGGNREVFNEGMQGIDLIEEIRKFNRNIYNSDDAFIFIIRCGEEYDIIRELFPDETIYSLTEYLDEIRLHDYFFDIPKHCNQKGCEKIAEYIFSVIKDKLENNETSKPEEISCSQKTKHIEIIENKELQAYVDILKQYKRPGKNGAIVMNCNPFTNGHLYLIEKAAMQVDHLFIFVVEEDKSYFSFSDRIDLVRKGVAGQVQNVTVIPSGKFVISTETFPEYFVKDALDTDIYIDTSYDIEIFAAYIAPALNIGIRFVGEEPFDYVTKQYNRDMKKILPQYGIEVMVVPRKSDARGDAISASTVRKLLEAGNMEEIKAIVPESTYQYLLRYKDLS